jgi:hypothetical protein
MRQGRLRKKVRSAVPILGTVTMGAVQEEQSINSPTQLEISKKNRVAA